MKILLLPDSFKGSLSAQRAADILCAAANEVLPDAEVVKLPAADGGEGTLEAVKAAVGGAYLPLPVTGPCGQSVQARYLSVGDTAVIELAQAAGLGQRLPGFSPMRTTTYGVGQLISHALQVGHRRILLGLGGSATTDMGCGMAAALGTQFLNAKGQPFLPVGETLHLVKGVRLNGFFFQKNAPRIEALCDVENPLYGTNGAAYVFGPQKGADADEVKRLDAGLRVVAGLFEKQGAKVNSLPGGGAAGGAGAGVACFLNGRIASGIDVLLDLMKFDDLVKTADLIVTGEGSVDGQTAGGKAVQGIARRAAGKPVIVFSGSAKLDPASWEKLRASGVAAVFPIVQEPCTLAEAMARASDNLRVTALNVFSLLKLQQTAGLTQQHA